MALSRTSRGSATATGASNAVTGSFTPSDSSLLVALIAGVSDGSGDPTGTNAVSGGSLSWTKRKSVWVGDVMFGGWGAWAEIWTAPVTTGASMTVTSNPGTTQDGHYVSVVEYTGYDSSSPIGATASGTRTNAQGSLSITLDASPASTSEVVANVVTDQWQSPGAGAVTIGTGWTLIHDFPTAGAETDGLSEVRGSSTSTTVLWDNVDASNGDTSGAAAAVAIEIKVAPAAGGTARSFGIIIG